MPREPLAVEGALTIDRNAWGIGAPKRRFNPMSIEDEIPIRFRAEIPVGSPAGAAQDPEAPS